MSNFSIHREVQHLTERLYKLERDTRTILEEKDARIAKLEAVIRQLSRDPEMADEYVLAQINIENKARIERMEVALKDAENRAALHSSDAALLNANNDRIFKICRKALKEQDE